MRIGESGPRRRELRIGGACALEALDSGVDVLDRLPQQVNAPFEIVFGGGAPATHAPPEPRLIAIGQLDFERLRNLPRHFVLHVEDVGERRRHLPSPQRPAVVRVEQLYGDAQPRAGSLEARGDHDVDAQFAASGQRIDVGVAIAHHRRRRPHQERLDPGQLGDRRVCKAQPDMRVRRILGQVLERQHRNRTRVRSPRCGRGRRRGPQVGRHRRRIGVAIVRIPRHEPQNDPFEARRHVRAKRSGRRRCRAEDFGHDNGHGGSDERQPPRGGLIQDDAERIQIGSLVGVMAAKQFRREIRRRADDGARRRQRVGRMRHIVDVVIAGASADLGQAEVHHFHMSAGRQHDVSRRDIAMDHAAVVRGGERLGGLDADAVDLVRRQRSAADSGAKVFALHVLHHDERRAVMLQDFVDGADERVIERRGGPRFAKKTAPGLVGVQQLGRNRFQHDDAIEALVVRREDAAHAALPDAVANEIVTGAFHRALIRAGSGAVERCQFTVCAPVRDRESGGRSSRSAGPIAG